MTGSAYNRKSVTVIGGGIAGLAAAVFLTDKDFEVTLIEASPKLGGRAYSFFDKTFGSTIDNGQHILANWYHDTFDFLKIIGSFEKLSIQKQLEVRFFDSNSNEYHFKCPNLPPPFHLIAGILRFKALKFGDKRAMSKLVSMIRKNRISSEELKDMNTDELFSKTGQTEGLINNFWKPFIIAVFNAEPENTSALMFAEMIRTGFLEKGGSQLVLPDNFLSDIFSGPAVEYLIKKKAVILTGLRVQKINFEEDRVTSIITEDTREFKSDFYISAVPFFEFRNLMGESVYNMDFSKVEGLKPSPIVNIHLKFENSIDNIFKGKFAGFLGTRTQWIFKVQSSQVCLVISSAKEIAELNKDEIVKIAVNDMCSCLPGLKEIKITESRVIKEMRATFVPDSESITLRPGSKTNFSNFFIAGDWTDTGLPATIEGAVKSGKKCANEIQNFIKYSNKQKKYLKEG
jgi:zeta-carotene desaturase